MAIHTVNVSYHEGGVSVLGCLLVANYMEMFNVNISYILHHVHANNSRCQSCQKITFVIYEYA